MRRACAAFILSIAAFLPSFGEGVGPVSPARPRVALVLSGGSALGLAHIGVIRELERAGIPIDMVLGTSMGALVGGLYAAGYSPDEMEAIVVGLDWSHYFIERRSAPADRYLDRKHERYPLDLGFDGKKPLFLFSALTLHVLPTRNFDDLPVPYRAIAADIVTGDKVVFSSGSIAEAMRASMSIPGVFSPYAIDGRSLVDGGIADNMPVDVAREMGADIVIAVECRQRSPSDSSSLDSTLKITGQTINLFIEENMRRSRAGADVFIRPDLAGYGSTSFANAAALIAKGEAGARACGPALSSLAERIAASRPLASPESEPNRRAMRKPPTMARLLVEAPSPSDEAVARKAFGGLVGRPLDRAEVEGALDSVYAAGGYSFVKLDLLPEGEEVVGLVRIVAAEPHKDEILFGGSYPGLLSTMRSSEVSTRLGAYLGDLFGKDSALFAEFGIGSLTRAYAEYFQPVGPVYAMPFLRYQTQYDYYSLDRGLALRSDFVSAGGGMGIGYFIGKTADLRIGWACDSAQGLDGDVSSDSEIVVPSWERDVAGYLFLDFGLDDRPATVFPERGFSADFRARWADPSFGGADSFIASDLRWNAALPLAKRLSLGFAGCAATDFSGLVRGASALPQTRLFELRSNGMFYGLEPTPDFEYGHHLLGLGLELRQKLGKVSRLLGGEIFGLANVSVAAAYEGDVDDYSLLPLRWNPSLGLGLRVSRDFGVLLAGGGVFDSDDIGSLRPALSFQLGSFADFPEDRRQL
jgi:NTE family protein